MGWRGRLVADLSLSRLQYGKARAAWSKALRAIDSIEQRSEFESTQNWMQSESDTAYSYAGLACGITLADMATIRFDSQRHAARCERAAEEPAAERRRLGRHNADQNAVAMEIDRWSHRLAKGGV